MTTILSLDNYFGLSCMDFIDTTQGYFFMRTIIPMLWFIIEMVQSIPQLFYIGITMMHSNKIVTFDSVLFIPKRKRRFATTRTPHRLIMLT